MQPNAKINCPHCGEAHPASAKFCPSSGKSIQLYRTVCPTCGAEIATDASFCPSCGNPLVEEKPTTQKRKEGSVTLQRISRVIPVIFVLIVAAIIGYVGYPTVVNLLDEIGFPWIGETLTTPSEGAVVRTNRDGQVVLLNATGDEIHIRVADPDGNAVDNAGISYVSNEEGILALIVPDVESNLLPTYHFLESTVVSTARGKLAAPISQGPITIHLPDESSSSIINQTEVPPELAEDLWDSSGWEEIVTTTGKVCRTLSILEDLEDGGELNLVSLLQIGHIQFELTRAYIWTLSPKALAMRVGLPFMTIGEGVLQICLMATGDPSGFAELTGVIHEELDYGIVFTEQRFPSILSGTIVDGQTGKPLANAVISSGANEVQTFENGVFFILQRESDPEAIQVELAGYEYRELLVPFMYGEETSLGEIALAPQKGTISEEGIKDTIAFVSRDREESTGSHIWLINPQKPDQTIQITDTPEEDNYPIWSPDGTRLVFQRYRPSDNRMSLWVSNVDGGNPRQITQWWDRGVGNLSPEFWYLGPEGERIYFVKAPGGGPCNFLWVYADGPPDQLENPVYGAEHKCSPDLSPDQRKLVFINYGLYQDLEVGELSVNGKEVYRIEQVVDQSHAPEFVQPAWSPDGSRIIFAMAEGDWLANVYSVYPDGSGLTKITFFENCLVDIARWSPDGQWLVASVRDKATEIYDLYVIPSDGAFRPIYNLTADDLYDGYPDWRDGSITPPSEDPQAGEPGVSATLPNSSIIFTSKERALTNANDIWAIDPNNPSDLLQLTNQEDVNYKPLVSPDGSLIAFTRKTIGYDREELFVMNADGTEVRQLTGAYEALTAQFWSPDGKRIYIVISPMGGPCSFTWVEVDGSSDQDPHAVLGADTNVCNADVSTGFDQIVYRGYGLYQDISIADLIDNGLAIENSEILVPHDLIPDSRENVRPAWSPDGTKIAFSVDEGHYLSNIYTISITGDELTKVTYFTSAYVSNPDWSLDSKWLTLSASYTQTEPTRGDIYVVPADGSFFPVINLTDDLIMDGNPAWGSSQIISADQGSHTGSFATLENRKPYYPLSGCGSSRLYVGDRASIAEGSEKVLIRSSPDTDTTQSNIGTVQTGKGVWIVGGPECNSGRIFWEIETENGLRGWVPETDATEGSIQLIPIADLGSIKAPQEFCGDHHEGEVTIVSPSYGELKSTTLLRFILQDVPDASDYSISGQLDDGWGGIVGHMSVYSEEPSFNVDIHNCYWSFIPGYDCAAAVDEVMARDQVVFSGAVIAQKLGSIDPVGIGSFCVVFKGE